MTAAAVLRLPILVMTAEWAAAENPSPPYDSGMINPKNLWCLRSAQMSGGRSPSMVIVGRSSMAQSSSTGPLRKACSRSESGCGTNWSNFRQSGVPENRSRSHQTVPASRAIRSVSPNTGSSGPIRRMTDRLTSLRRKSRETEQERKHEEDNDEDSEYRRRQVRTPPNNERTGNHPGPVSVPAEPEPCGNEEKNCNDGKGRHVSDAQSYTVRAR